MSERPAKYIVAVGSGKGGVGKSTVSLHIALALERRGLEVGLLDADVYGPDIPLMVNLTRHENARRWDFWRVATCDTNRSNLMGSGSCRSDFSWESGRH